MRLLHRGGAEGWKTGCMDGDTGSWSCTAGPGPSPCPAGGVGEVEKRLQAAAKQSAQLAQPILRGSVLRETELLKPFCHSEIGLTPVN